MLRRAVLLLAVLGWLPLAGAAWAQEARADDMVLGRADAPVTVVEYASVTCPHCAHWHAEVFPEFRRRFIDTGRVRFVFREMPTAPAEFAIAGFVLARCAGPDHYFAVIDDLMAEQREVVAEGYPRFVAIGARHGVSEAEFETCLSPDGVGGVADRAEAAVEAGIRSTPTFLVNGRRLNGEASLADLEALIRQAER